MNGPMLCRLDGTWRMEHSSRVKAAGAEVSSSGLAVGGWHPARVPTTVLSALVKDGTYPDPRFGLDTYRIPDASDELNRAHGLERFCHLPDGRNPWTDPWWFRTEFDLADPPAGGRAWLDLDSVNYRAEVWLNRRKVAGRDEIVGMFRRFRLDVTGIARSGANCLAILVWLPDHPGTPDTQLEVYQSPRGFFKEIMRDVTEVMTIGYDCFATVPDRNMGIVGAVRVETTGPVELRRPFVRADLELPALDPAMLHIEVEAANAGARVVAGVLVATVAEEGTGRVVATVRRELELGPREARTLVLDASEYAELALANPRLWWPRGYGEQPLYKLTLRLEAAGTVSHEIRTMFGIRRLNRELHRVDGAHGFRLLVNGERIFCRGGYVQPELLLDWDAGRIESELRYLAHANQNFIVFEDIPNPPDVLLELCDRMGIMFWQCFYGCFWMQPSVDDELESGVVAHRHPARYPDDLGLLEACTIDLVERYRNHPSLVIYMAQNEAQTRKPVYEMWRRTLLALDPTRCLVPSGYFPDYMHDQAPSWIEPDLPVGMNDLAPKSYGWEQPETYFRWVREDRTWMFKIESGSASVPALESLRRFIPSIDAMPGNLPKRPDWPLDATWAHHGANSYFRPFDTALRAIYGEPTDIEDYCWKAHFMAAVAHRAMREAVNHRMWELTSGFGDWKLNAAFPDVQWQLYDWFLRPTVSLYFVRKSCAPLVVQLSPLDQSVCVVNNTLAECRGLVVRARIVNLALRTIGEREATLDVRANAFREVFTLPRPQERDLSNIQFVRLELRDSSGALLADNFYWLPWHRAYDTTSRLHRMPELRRLPRARVVVDLLSALAPAIGGRDELAGRVRVANPSADRLVFFLRLAVGAGPDGEEALPSWWDDNYLSLLPGEERTIGVRLPAASLGGKDPWLRIDGSNVESETHRWGGAPSFGSRR